MPYISQEERWAIIAHWKQNEDSHTTARELKLTFKVFQRWIQQYEATRDVEDAQESGSCESLTPRCKESP
jgi:hypothetical protein